MAQSTCIKCGHYEFEIMLTTPNNSRYPVYLVQCANCGGVVGVQEYSNPVALIEKLAKELGVSLK